MENESTRLNYTERPADRIYRPMRPATSRHFGSYLMFGNTNDNDQYKSDLESLKHADIPSEIKNISLAGEKIENFFIESEHTLINQASNVTYHNRRTPVFDAIAKSNADVLILDGFDFRCSEFIPSQDDLFDQSVVTKDKSQESLSRCLREMEPVKLSLKNSPGKKGDYSLRPFFLSGLLENKSLNSVDLSGANLTSQESRYVADFIMQSPNLQEISFSDCELDDEDWQRIADALMHNPKVLVRGHDNPFLNTAEMRMHRERLLEVCKAIATHQVEELADGIIRDAIDNFFVVERAIAQESILQLDVKYLPVDVDGKIGDLINEARIRGIDIPQDVQEKHRDKLMGAALIPSKRQKARQRKSDKEVYFKPPHQKPKQIYSYEDIKKADYPAIEAEVTHIDLSNESLASYICNFRETTDDKVYSSDIEVRFIPVLSAISASNSHTLLLDNMDFICDSFEERKDISGEYTSFCRERTDRARTELQHWNINNFSTLSMKNSPSPRQDLSRRFKSLRNDFFVGLEKNSSIQFINFTNSNFSADEVSSIVSLIRHSDALLEIDFTDCDFEKSAWDELAVALKQKPLILVKGHPDPSLNTGEMSVHRERLLELGMAIASQPIVQMNDETIRDALGSLIILERALSANSVLEIPEEYLPVDVDAKVDELINEARIRGIDIPQDVQEKHRDKLMGAALVAPKGHRVQTSILETMLRADKSIDIEVGLHDALVSDITREINQLVSEHAETQQARQAAVQALKQAERDAERTNTKLDGMIAVRQAEGRAAAKKRSLLDEADERLSHQATNKAQIARGLAKMTVDGLRTLSTAGIDPRAWEGLGNAAGDFASAWVGDTTDIEVRRDLRGIEADVEASCRHEIIDILEAQKIDTSKHKREVSRLTDKLKKIVESKQIQEIRQDEVKQERIASSILRQRLVKSGLDVVVELEKHYMPEHGFDSVDTFLAAFEDDRLSDAMRHLCYGRADSNDMEVIIAESNAFSEQDELKPHQQALHRFVEEYVKSDIDGFMTKASFVDAIRDLNLLNLETLGFAGEVDKKAPKPNQRGELVIAETDKNSTKSRIALMSALADQYGERHIGDYYIQRLFRFWLTRHGDTTLVADEVLDGNQIKYNQLVGKEVNIQPERDMRRFAEAVKRGGSNRQEDMPMPDDLFMRVCGYEYYLPQAVRTHNNNNKLSENPEAPIAYPMVNKVVTEFVKRMVNGGLEDYRGKVGSRLDNVVAQSFIDFFATMGRRHREQFASEREALRTGFGHDLYTRKFTPHMQRITSASLAEFDTFLDIYARNLEKYMQVVPSYEQAELRQQVEAVKELAEGRLSPPILEPGSHADRERARRDDHTLANITENFGRRAG